MKGAIEFYTMLLIFMVVTILGIQIVNGFVMIQYTHLQTEAAVSVIEEFDTYNSDVRNRINEQRVCFSCDIEVKQKNNLTYVIVSNKLSIPLIKWTKTISFTSIPNI